MVEAARVSRAHCQHALVSHFFLAVEAMPASALRDALSRLSLLFALCNLLEQLGDFLAHGLVGGPAAVEAAMLDSVMRTYSEPVDAGPETVAGYLNRYMFTRRPRAAFISAFLCNYNPNTRILSYVNCGHPPPFLLQASGECAPLDVPPDIPLCVVHDYAWTRYERVMQPGDTLILYTDGVTETRRNGQELGVQGLRALIQPTGTAAGILDGIHDGIRKFLNGKTATDDQTLIVIRWNDS